MNRPAVALLALALLSLPGCIQWDGTGTIEVDVLITQDLGREPLRTTTILDLREGATAMDALMAMASVETAYGGGFVHAIDGLSAGTDEEGHAVDWFYEVNGQLMGVGAAEVPLEDGDRVHWDHRAWRSPTDVPGLLNTFPWDSATVLLAPGLDTDTVTANVPWSTVAGAAPWNGTWPEGAAVLVAPPEEAPWDAVPGLETAPDVDGPWSLATRIGPVNTVRALIVLAGEPVPEAPTSGIGWLQMADGRSEEVRPWTP